MTSPGTSSMDLTEKTSATENNDSNKTAAETNEKFEKFNEEKKRRANLRQMRMLNMAPKRPDANEFKKLDSSIKKTTALRRKLVKITSENEDQLLKEMTTLNLTRYINEIVTAILATPLRIIDVPSAVKICSLLHQMYTDFSSEFLPALRKMVLPANKQDDLQRKRSALRLLIELFVCGMFNDANGSIFCSTLEAYNDDFDKDQQSSILLILNFVRYGKSDLLGIKSDSGGRVIVSDDEKQPINNNEMEDDFEPLLSKELQTKLNNTINASYTKIGNYLITLHTDLRNLEKQNHEIEMTKGEVSAEATAEYQKQRSIYEKTVANVTSLSELLQLPFPKLPVEKKMARVEIQSAFKSTTSAGALKPGSLIWEDEGMRLFYEDLHNLALIVHPALLGPINKETEEVPTKEGETTAEPEATGGGPPTVPRKPPTTTAEEKVTEEPEEVLEPSQQEAFNQFVQKLDTMMSPSIVDQMAIDFCYLSKRGNKKRLVNALFSVNRNKLDIIPYYARLVATLNPWMKEIGPGLVAKLETEFKQLYEEKNQLKIESKMKNIKFLSELVKFKICPHSVIFNCLKMCLDDFLHHNVDVACMLLETCGRYLYKKEDTSVKLNTMLERMMRSKKTKNLDNKQETMIENAYYSCKPPARLAIIKKEKSPLIQYLEKLIYCDLTEKNARLVMRKLRKIDWNTQEKQMVNIFLKIHKAKFDRIGTIASIIAGLAQHYENFGIRFVDLLLEYMRTALEERKYVYYQRLLLHTKLLGDLYNYSMIEHTMIFDRLYGLIDCNNGEIPVPLNLSENTGEDETKKKERETKIVNDEQYDLFRIRLVCTLLDTCGHYFKKGSHKDRLDLFLAHFQVYINAKIFWSRDIQFNIDDIFEELRPKATRYYTYESALTALKEAESKKNPKAIWGYKSYKITSVSATALIEEVEEDDKDSNLDNEDDMAERRGGDDDDDELQGDQYDDQAQDNVDTTPKSLEYIACKEDDAFLKELNAMMNDESSSSRSIDNTRSSLISIPMNLIKAQNPSNAPVDDNTINFKMLVKKGNKSKVLNLPIPVENKMASQHLREKEIQKEQKNELKKLTLQLDQRDRQQDEDRTNELSIGTQPYLKSDRGQSNSYYKDRNGFQGYPSFDDNEEDGNSPYGNLSTRTTTARGRGQVIHNNVGTRPYGNQTQGRGRK